MTMVSEDRVFMKIVSTVFVQFGEIILSGRVKNNWSKKRHGWVCIVNNVTFRVKLAVVNECKIAACPYSAYMSMFNLEGAIKELQSF